MMPMPNTRLFLYPNLITNLDPNPAEREATPCQGAVRHGTMPTQSAIAWKGCPHAMTPEEFIGKWSAITLTERSAAQSHFIDLCTMLGVPTPTDADPTGDFYAFEK